MIKKTRVKEGSKRYGEMIDSIKSGNPFLENFTHYTVIDAEDIGGGFLNVTLKELES